ACSYVFNELVKSYVADRGSFIYYEDFYQFIIDSYENTKKVESIFENAKSSLLEDHPRLSENVGYFGGTMPAISVKPCHYKRPYNYIKKLLLFLFQYSFSERLALKVYAV